jgi:hypothetical protein
VLAGGEVWECAVRRSALDKWLDDDDWSVMVRVAAICFAGAAFTGKLCCTGAALSTGADWGNGNAFGNSLRTISRAALIPFPCSPGVVLAATKTAKPIPAAANAPNSAKRKKLCIGLP